MYTRDEVLDKLIAAGLGGIEQHRITPDQYERAMAGEVVIPPRNRAPGSSDGKCPRCGAVKEHRSYSYCRKCRAERQRHRTKRYNLG